MSRGRPIARDVRGDFKTLDTVRSSDDNHMKMPPVGFGTYRLGGYECFDAVKHALQSGYRHIDTAMAYDNEAVVGRAIETSEVDRDDVFVTTKVKGYAHFLEYEQLLEAVEGSLERLGTDYVDLLLIHWWNSDADLAEVFAALNQLVEDGKVVNIGVSNFSVDQLDRAIAVSDVPLMTNQVQYHPYFEQDEMLEFCQKNDILLTAYSPLANGLVIGDEVLQSIGDRYGKSAAQVALRWSVQQENVVPIPKASSLQHAGENIDVFDFELTDAEMETIHDLEGPLSYRLMYERGPVTRFRQFLGPYVPKRVRNRVP